MKSVTVAAIALAAATAALLACALIFDVATLKLENSELAVRFTASVSAWKICMSGFGKTPGVWEDGLTSCVSNFSQQCTLVRKLEIVDGSLEEVYDEQTFLNTILCKSTALAQFTVGSKDYETQLDNLAVAYNIQRKDKHQGVDKSVGPALSVPFVGSMLAAAAALFIQPARIEERILDESL